MYQGGGPHSPELEPPPCPTAHTVHVTMKPREAIISFSFRGGSKWVRDISRKTSDQSPTLAPTACGAQMKRRLRRAWRTQTTGLSLRLLADALMLNPSVKTLTAPLTPACQTLVDSPLELSLSQKSTRTIGSLTLTS